MKKLLALVLALIMLCGMTAALAEEPVTIELWLAGNDDSLYGAYEKAAQAYIAENPNVTININMIAWSEYFTKLSASFVGGTGPDVFAAGYGQFFSLMDGGYMMNLAPYVPADWDGYNDIPSNVLDIGRVNGDLYALLVPEGRALYYRKDIAAEQGVTEEDLKIENLDDLIELAKKMTIKEGDEVIVEGFELITLNANSPEQQLYLTAMMEGGDVLWKEDLAMSVTEDAYITALNKTKALLDEGYAIPQSAGINYFNTDVAAMRIDSQTAIEGASLAAIEGLGGEIGAVPLPKSVLLGQWYAVNPATKIPAEAADFLFYLFSSETQTLLFNEIGQYPSRTSLKEIYCGDNELRKVYSAAIDNSFAYGTVPNPYFLTWANGLRSACEAVYAGSQDAVTAMTEYVKSYNEICGLN